MKKLLPLLLLTFILLSCSKKDKEQDPVIEPTNELVGTIWERYIT